MTLLNKLQSALNKVNGNTLMIEDDRGYDEYYCTECNKRVHEDEYVHKHSICYKCHHKDI